MQMSRSHRTLFTKLMQMKSVYADNHKKKQKKTEGSCFFSLIFVLNKL